MEFLSKIFTEPVILSGFGGLAYPLLAFLEFDNIKKSKCITFRKFRDYFAVLIYVFLAILMGYAYFEGKEDVNRLLAIHIGISSPLILRTMTNILPSGIKNKAE